MRTIAIFAASTVLAAVGGSTAAFAYTSTQADGAAGGPRIERGAVQPASFVRSGGRVVPVSAGDDHRRRHAEPGDDHRRRHAEPREDHRRRHAEPGDDHGRHAEPGDDHGRHAEPGDDHGRHGHGGDDRGHHRHGSDG